MDANKEKTAAAVTDGKGQGGCDDLWNLVVQTDPAYTKPFSTDTFSGTSISPMYLIRKATEQFGPVGIGWGWTIEKEEILDGAPILDKDGRDFGCEKVHKVEVKLWYLTAFRGEQKRGEVTQFGNTTFVGRRNGFLYTNEDASKMSVTDAVTKCLSVLGFGADIHLGLFDDSKYVNGIHGKVDRREVDSVSLNAGMPAPQGAATPESTPARSVGVKVTYEGIKARLDNKDLPIASVAAARATIKQSTLSESEKQSLLKHPRLAESQGSDEDRTFL